MKPQHTPTWTTLQGILDHYDAAFIVRAVNCHQELLALLKEAEKFIGLHDGCSRMSSNAYFLSVRIKKAIAKAEGK